jgi:hypothetical protein
MAAKKEIVVKIAPNGSTEIDAVGFAGNSCATATKELEQVLVGSGTVKDKKKPEFFRNESAGPARTHNRI